MPEAGSGLDMAQVADCSARCAGDAAHADQDCESGDEMCQVYGGEGEVEREEVVRERIVPGREQV